MRARRLSRARFLRGASLFRARCLCHICVQVVRQLPSLSCEGLKPHLLPDARFVDKLATEAVRFLGACCRVGVVNVLALQNRQRKKENVCNPFVWCTMDEARPKWSVLVKSDAEEACAEGGASCGTLVVPKRTWSIAAWAAAFNRYALAAGAVGQLKFPSAMAHLDNVLMLAEEARARYYRLQMCGGARVQSRCVGRKTSPSIAILYDEAIRRQWADYAQNNIPGFDVNVAALSIDREVLRRLEVVPPCGCGLASHWAFASFAGDRGGGQCAERSRTACGCGCEAQ